MAMIDFWLNYCVFPRDTKQFPQRMTANSWHVAENPRGGSAVVGFSGTNDNHRLLPLQVRQAELDEPSLRGTNGKMLSLVLLHTAGYNALPEPPVVSKPGGMKKYTRVNGARARVCLPNPHAHSNG